MNFQVELTAMGEKARAAGRRLAILDTDAKNRALKAIADEIRIQADAIRAENAKDLAAGRQDGLTDAMLDRLELSAKRIDGMIEGLEQVVALPDPVGNIDFERKLYNDLELSKVRVPIGVIGIIYESRPNVTVDAAALCLKAGNAVILRGGKEAIHSNRALARVIADGCTKAGLDPATIQLIPWTDREAVGVMLKMDEYIDCIIPRGGEGLIRFVANNATMPVIKHYKGVCHVYVHADANIEMALNITENAKCQRPGVCNAIETLLIHKDIADDFVPKLAERLLPKGVEFRGDAAFQSLCSDSTPATEDDWYEEFLDLRLAVRIVDSIDDAIAHIEKYGSAHSDAIVSTDPETCEKFLNEVDSSTVYANASTRFTDGFQFGMGAEIGISTDRIHARGPMGLEELTTYKYKVRGVGQVRS